MAVRLVSECRWRGEAWWVRVPRVAAASFLAFVLASRSNGVWNWEKFEFGLFFFEVYYFSPLFHRGGWWLVVFTKSPDVREMLPELVFVLLSLSK